MLPLPGWINETTIVHTESTEGHITEPSPMNNEHKYRPVGRGKDRNRGVISAASSENNSNMSS
jgi:hypothetical protein